MVMFDTFAVESFWYTHVAFTCSVHTCQSIQFTSVEYSFFITLGGCGYIGKWIQENIMFMRFCCFKLSKNIEKLSYEQLTHAIANCSLTGLVQQAKKSRWKWDLKLRMCISHDIASSFHCRIHWLEFKMPLPPAKNPKDPCLHKGNRGSQTLD